MIAFPRDTLRISITSKCNMDCIYCHKEGGKEVGELTIEQFEKIIVAAKKYGLKKVRLTGGDPLCHDNVFQMCEIAKNKYGLVVEINTNAVAIDKLLGLILHGLISKVVVGIDYYDGTISKNSIHGLPSEEIKQHILRIQETGCEVNVDAVYDGDYNNIRNMVNWCLLHKIRIKIIEIVDKSIASSETPEYIIMQNGILSEFNLKPVIDELGEVNGYRDGMRLVSFLHSLCRLRKCVICRKIQLRVSCTGIAKNCIQDNANDIDLLSGDIERNIEEAIVASMSIKDSFI